MSKINLSLKILRKCGPDIYTKIYRIILSEILEKNINKKCALCRNVIGDNPQKRILFCEECDIYCNRCDDYHPYTTACLR